MPQTYTAMAVSEPGGRFAAAEVDLTDPPRGHVRVKVEATGICHSDAMLVAGHMPGIGFPLVTGHEIAGRVEVAGEDSGKFAAGDRVAVGWFGGSCDWCRPCREGDFIHCDHLLIPGLSYPGGYAERVMVPAKALARIPDELTAVEAAPMGCAGVTTFNSLRRSSARSGDLVAVLGIGGLGHLGVQFAAKMGFEVAAIARGGGKEELARQLGAHHYIDSQGQDPAAELKRLGRARVALATVTSNAAIPALIDGLGPRGELIVLGVDPEPLPVSTLALISPGRRIIGHPSGTAQDTEDTMRFAALSGVRPMTETRPLADAQAAFDRMMSGEARFRMILTT